MTILVIGIFGALSIFLGALLTQFLVNLGLTAFDVEYAISLLQAFIINIVLGVLGSIFKGGN
jgi:hypothetical protein